jgi:hypothetical protein
MKILHARKGQKCKESNHFLQREDGELEKLAAVLSIIFFL